MARWKSQAPVPEWWDLYLKRLEPSEKAVRARLALLGMEPEQATATGWWSSPTHWAIVTLNKGVYHVSEFPRGVKFSELVRPAPLPVSSQQAKKPAQTDLFG